MTPDRFTVAPGGALTGEVRVPGDKSVSHRAVMFAALADGACRIEGCLLGEDVRATIAAFRALGAELRVAPEGRIDARGVGIDGLRSPGAPLDLGNSGTSMRLITGILAGAGVDATLTGDASLSRRPMRRVTEPLARMGANVATAPDGTPPIVVGRAPDGLAGIDYALPVASAQVKSALLLAGLYARGRTTVREPAPTRDHTERMLETFGVSVERDGAAIAIAGGQRLTAADVAVPADVSSAAFFLVGAAVASGSRLELPGVGVNPTRTGVLDILEAMGARIERRAPRACGAEPVSDLAVSAAPLRGIEIPAALVPLAIDEFPALFVAAACAEGTTVLRGAEELRHKESDRIAVMADGLGALGVDHEVLVDGIVIRGGPIEGGTVDARGDHRVAMAFAMAALRARGPVTVTNAAAVATSFPGFHDTARAAGLAVSA